MEPDVLNLINDIHLRKVIKKARNRTESYHQLQNTIRKTYSGVFKGRKIVSNAISNQASRLVANCIIAYNATLLEHVYQRLVVRYGKASADQVIARLSPVAWQHILFTGRYHFKNHSDGIEIDKFVNILEGKLEQILINWEEG